ncbi:heterokaryon incompatibility protein-domain-containing protein [Aspergillus transmontanensis]|uniref:Heterokaryon incompatibility protein-domain-containing protein n=1 Tax=Aspergillus transmontanensis TaxID=1034304 RepID=A0A5N6VYG8_9EURO|nr:heterokaryon incompatibility protein-domain-containing protein [Aspergillus transmontanensis]
MWLLNARTSTLEDFFESQAPPYAILSHTWGAEEVSFQDIQERQEVCKKKKGYKKIIHICRQALKHGLEYAWVDTCCIDKSSSSELSEAINSMFRWYGKATVCYAFLADVPPGCNPHDHQGPFAKSRWFTRGWTLQELLAPENIVFYASDWSYIATKIELCKELNLITGIDIRYLSSGTAGRVTVDTQSGSDSLFGSVKDNTQQRRSLPALHQASIAERMSWASSRQTTRTEDMAYCLLGIFGINMPLIYGEGERAFTRLQEEIIKAFNDQSILAWGDLEPWKNCEYSVSRFFTQMHRKEKRMGVLARSPAAFRACGSIIPSFVDNEASFHLSVPNKGLHISLPMSQNEPALALLQCRSRDNPTVVLAIALKQVQGNIYSRADNTIIRVDHRTWSRWSRKEIYLSLEDHIEEELYERKSSFPGSSIFIRHIPHTLSVQELSPHARNLTSDVFPPDHATIPPGLSPCTGNIALLLTSKKNSYKAVLYFSLTELPRTFLIKVPYHSTNSDVCDYLFTLKSGQSYVWWGKDVLYFTVTLQSVAGVPLFVIDIRLSSRIPHGSWFGIQCSVPVDIRGLPEDSPNLWEALDFLFDNRLPTLILIWLAQDATLRLIGWLFTSSDSSWVWLRFVVSQVQGMALTSGIVYRLSFHSKGHFAGDELLTLAAMYSVRACWIATTLSLILAPLQGIITEILGVASPILFIGGCYIWLTSRIRRKMLPYEEPIFSL